MRRRYIYFLLTYFHNSSKKEQRKKKYSIKSTINSTKAKIKLSSAPSARHVLVRPEVVWNHRLRLHGIAGRTIN